MNLWQEELYFWFMIILNLRLLALLMWLSSPVDSLRVRKKLGSLEYCLVLHHYRTDHPNSHSTIELSFPWTLSFFSKISTRALRCRWRIGRLGWLRNVSWCQGGNRSGNSDGFFWIFLWIWWACLRWRTFQKVWDALISFCEFVDFYFHWACKRIWKILKFVSKNHGLSFII